MKDGLWWPQGYRDRDPRFFTFDFVSRTELRLADLGSPDGLPLPPAKFIRHLPQTKSGIPIRGGIARTVAWAWMFKSFTLKDWMAFLDVYGMPMRVGKYHPNATEPERRTLLRAVASIASDAAAIIPESMQIEFVEAKGFADKPFETFGQYLDDQIATFVLGQTLTTRDGGSLGQAKVHNTIRLDLAENDAFELGVTIDQDLIAWFVALNFGADAPSPRRVPGLQARGRRRDVDGAGRAGAIGAGGRPGGSARQDGLTTPAPGAKLLKPPTSAAPAEPPEGDPTTKQAVRQAALNRATPGCACATCRTARTALSREAPAVPQHQPDLVDQIGIDGGASPSPPQRPAGSGRSRMTSERGGPTFAIDARRTNMPLPPILLSNEVQKQAYDDLAKGSMRQFGDACAVLVRKVLSPQFKSPEERDLDWRLGQEESENRRRLAAEALDRVSPERRVLPAPQIAGPIFRDSEFELPETPIWEMWSELLSRACDRERAGEAHPSYPAVIRSLSNDEAQMLATICQAGTAGAYSWTEERKLGANATLRGMTFSFHASQVSLRENFGLYLRRLAHLDLIEKFNDGDHQNLGSAFEGHVLQKIAWRLTPEGKAFMTAVSNPLQGATPGS